jgi:hypothetical protein
MRTAQYHLLEGVASAIAEWFKGTGWRLFVDTLDEEERRALLETYEERLAGTYKALAGDRDLLVFPRLFIVVGRRWPRDSANGRGSHFFQRLLGVGGDRLSTSLDVCFSVPYPGADGPRSRQNSGKQCFSRPAQLIYSAPSSALGPRYTN